MRIGCIGVKHCLKQLCADYRHDGMGDVTYWRRQYVEILPLTDKPPSFSLRPPHMVRSHHRWRAPDRLACNCLVGATPAAHYRGFRSRMPRQQLRQEELAHQEAFSIMGLLPSEPVMRGKNPCRLEQSPLFIAHLFTPRCTSRGMSHFMSQTILALPCTRIV